MAGTVKITDFIRWAMQRIDPAELSAAMTEYGYTDDSAQSVIDALERHPEFSQRFAVLLGEGQAARMLELQRTNQGDDELTLEDWAETIGRKKANLATGLSGAAETEKKENWWSKNGTATINTILGVAGGVLSSIFGNGAAMVNGQQQQPQQQQQSGSMTFVWIIVGVVVVAAIGLIAVSVMKKK